MLKVAIPNKGSLSDSAIAMLKEAGYRQRSDARDLVLIDSANNIEFYYLRPRDIALYVASGELEVGITGRDLLIDSGAAAVEALALDFGKSTFRFAAPLGVAASEGSLAGLRIASAYPGLVENYLASKKISASVVRLDGAVESSVRLGVADVIADVVSTGGTLRQAGLATFGEPILHSEAVLIERPLEGQPRKAEVETLLRRLQGVVIAKQYVLVDYDVQNSFLDAACALTPGIESPTVSALQKEGWSAVRAMVKRSDINRIMDDLWSAGARGILVTDIHACRL
jgi:ATP phosphoribosyltransferase